MVPLSDSDHRSNTRRLYARRTPTSIQNGNLVIWCERLSGHEDIAFEIGIQAESMWSRHAIETLDDKSRSHIIIILDRGRAARLLRLPSVVAQ